MRADSTLIGGVFPVIEPFDSASGYSVLCPRQVQFVLRSFNLRLLLSPGRRREQQTSPWLGSQALS